jgi:hypothetical protein
MATAPVPAPDQGGPDAITVVSHSNLFYWWPLWFVGFLLGILTLFEPYRLAVLPHGSEGYRKATGQLTLPSGDTKAVKGQDVILVPEGEHLLGPDHKNPSAGDPEAFTRHVSASSRYGVLWVTILLLVIVITNVPLRGLWSVIVIVTIILLSIIFALADWWTPILNVLGRLDIRINAGGYFLVSGVLFGIWLVTLLLFDRQIYIVFTPGQMKVCTEIGGGEKVYDTTGMKLEKQRSDLFRHWILGLGSGDLIVRTAGAAGEHFDLQNVLFISKKVEQIEAMLKRRQVVAK